MASSAAGHFYRCNLFFLNLLTFIIFSQCNSLDPPSRNPSLENPYLTPVDSDLINSAQAAHSQHDPVNDVEIVEDAHPVEQPYMENVRRLFYQ